MDNGVKPGYCYTHSPGLQTESEECPQLKRGKEENSTKNHLYKNLAWGMGWQKGQPGLALDLSVSMLQWVRSLLLLSVIKFKNKMR